MAQTTTADTQSKADASVPPVAAWIPALAAITLLSMATQLRFPFAGGRIGVADVFLGLSFLAILWDQVRRGVRYRFPLALAIALGCYLVSGLIGRAGRDAAVESVQRFEQLFCGVLLFLFLVRERRSWLVPLLTVCIGLNLGAAAIHMLRYGYGSTLPPADVLALPWGIGRAYGGLFRDRVTLGLFLAMALVMVNPSWMKWAGMCRIRHVAVVLGLAAALACIAYGPLLVLAAIGLLLTGFFLGRRPAALNAAAILLCVLILRLTPAGAVLRETLSPFKPGEGVVKTCYSDAVAAMRMAARRPLTGVGAGSYQRYIGRCYGELPNPNFNDIETDTQSGIGILLGTVGYPAGMAMLLVFLIAVARALRHALKDDDPRPLVLGAAVASGLALCAMLVTDPFVRGPAWFVALAFALAYGESDEAYGTGISLGWGKTLLAGMLFALGAALIFVLPSKDALAGTHALTVLPRKSVGSGSSLPTIQTTAAATMLPSATDEGDFFRIIDAGAAALVSPPFIKAKDSLAANQTILRVPDKKGKPPEGAAPDMKYGGAAFDLTIDKEVAGKIWLRVWWEGSCGNTVFVKMDDGKPVVVGNDGTYDAWHWLEAPHVYTLKPGKHKLYVLNREDGIRIDQILMTNDMEYFPQGIEEE